MVSEIIEPQQPAPTATTTPVATPIPTADPSQTDATAAAAAKAFLNQERLSCGFGGVTTNAKLDQAAADANGYFTFRMAEGDRSYAHTQVSGKTGFTGVNGWDRAAYRGYPNALTGTGTHTAPRASETLMTQETLPGFTLAQKNVAAQAMAQSLLNTVYHLAVNMSPLSDVGASFVSAPAPDGNTAFRMTFLQGDLTFVDTGKPGTTQVRTYPCEGSRVPNVFVPSLEAPNPAPDLGSRKVGTPILVQFPPGQTAMFDSIALSVVNTKTGAKVPFRTMLLGCTNPLPWDITSCSKGDGDFSNNQGFLLPLDPLEVDVPHRVTIAFLAGSGRAPIVFTFTPVEPIKIEMARK